MTSIAYTDSAGDAQTLAAANYQTSLSTNDGPARIKSAYGLTWPATRGDTYGAVVVTFVAGYADATAVPLTIKHATAFLVAHWFRQRESVIVGTISSELPEGLEMLLAVEDWGAYA